MKLTIGIILFSFLFLSCSSDDEIDLNQEKSTKDLLANAIGEEVAEITSSSPTENFSELRVLDDLAQTKFIGMGEASHGTKEFFEMKHKILRYFVENHGYRGIIMEADFGECVKANQYVIHNIGHIDDVINGMHFWTWRTDEVKDMIQWMHDYNIAKPMSEKVYYLGNDCQFTDDNLNIIEDMIDKLPSQTALSIQKHIDKLSKSKREILGYDEATFNEMISNADSLFFEISSHRAEINKQYSVYEYNLLLRLADVTRQVHEVTKGFILKEDFNYRDDYMAKNSVWWADQMEADDKFLIWAHNYHVSNSVLTSQYGGTIGGNLKVQLGENYKSIGFSMSNGSVLGIEGSDIVAKSLPVAAKNCSSINELFQLTNKNNFIWFFDNETASNTSFEWFNKLRDWISVGAVHPTADDYFRKIRLFEEFDAVIHFDTSNPSNLIPY